MTMVPGQEEGTVVPAEDRLTMALSQQGAAAPAAPAAPTPAAPAAPAVAPPPSSADVAASLDRLNESILSAIERSEQPAAPPAPAGPDPIAALLTHADPEVRALAQITLEQRERLAEIEQRTAVNEEATFISQRTAFEQELAAETERAATQFGLTQAEMDGVMERWNEEIQSDPRLAVLTAGEAAIRYIGVDALFARRAGVRAPAAGEGVLATPPAPRTGPPARAQLVTHTAAGGGAPARTEITGAMSNHDIARVALRERYGIEAP